MLQDTLNYLILVYEADYLHHAAAPFDKAQGAFGAFQGGYTSASSVHRLIYAFDQSSQGHELPFTGPLL